MESRATFRYLAWEMGWVEMPINEQSTLEKEIICLWVVWGGGRR